jgi:glucose-1-phosphate thymidylyltransferase
MFDDTIWDAVKGIRPARATAQIRRDRWLVDHGKSVHPHLVSGWWKDTGKIEDMLEANRIILDTFTARGLGRSTGDAGSRQGRRQPGAKYAARCAAAVIGAGAEIRDAFVGPYTAVGPNCLIDRCEIENSIVLEDSRLERIPVIAFADRQERGSTRSRAARVHRFLVGDSAEIRIV